MTALRRAREWLRRLIGSDDESEEIRRQFREAVAAAPVAAAIEDVLAAAEHASREARREARKTPPPLARPRTVSIPEDF